MSRLWTVNYSLSIGIGVVLFALLFPDGRFVPLWTRWVALAALLEEVATLAWPDSPFSRVSRPESVQS